MTEEDSLKTTPPLRLESLKTYTQEIFTHIKAGENVTTVWVAMAGRRIKNKFIISYPELFRDEIGEVDKYLLVYVEPLELTEETNTGFLKLLINSIVENCNKQGNGKLKPLILADYLPSEASATYAELLEITKRLVEKILSQDKEIVLFLGEFDELKFAGPVLFNNLKSLWSKFEGKLHFIFMLLEDATKPEAISKYGELNELLLQNVIYIPLLGDEDVEYLLNYFTKQYHREFSQEEKDLLVKICGNHPYLLKSCSRLIALMNGQKLSAAQLEEKLMFHFEPRSASQKIFDGRSPAEKDFLKKLVVDQTVREIPEEAGTLAKLGLIKKGKEGTWVPFGELFASCIEGERRSSEKTWAAGKKLSFDEATGAILMDNENIEEKFTRQEYEVLMFFLKEASKLKSRDEIGEAMWGKESYDKYSDWAIDQLVSKLRKKLEGLGAANLLVTVRGRGYKLVMD